MSDRTVHASWKGMEVVRYDRAGKWYLEPTDPTLKREPVEKHGRERLEREEENMRRNAPDGPSAPHGFSPFNAGETWDEEAA